MPQFQTLRKQIFDLIITLCAHLNISPEIEFTCMDSFETYYKNLVIELDKSVHEQFKKELHRCTDESKKMENMNRIINEIYEKTNEDSLLRILSLISICAKFVDGYHSWNILKAIPNLLRRNRTLYTSLEIRKAEYQVFRNLGFIVSFCLFFCIT